MEGSMLKAFELKGGWFLPANPQSRVSGLLRYDPTDGANLELMGSFKGISDIGQPPQEYPIILGHSTEYGPITLYKCLGLGTSVRVPGSITSSFYAHIVFNQVHFQTLDGVRFTELSLSFSYLNEWLGISGFETESTDDGVIVKFKVPPKLTGTTFDDYAISVRFSGSGLPGHAQVEVHIRQKAWVSIQSGKERHFEDFLKVVRLVQDFLSLAVNEPVYPLEVVGRTEANKTRLNERDYYPGVQVYFPFPWTPAKPKDVRSFDMLFMFNDMKGRFDAFLGNWLEKANVLAPVYELYFATLYNPRLFTENKFLNLVYALESYHRRRIRNLDLPEEEHNKRVKHVLESTPAEHREWLSRKLAYSNEPTLRRRLEEILDRVKGAWSLPRADAFIEKVVQTRNYLTHFDKDLERYAAQNEELYRVIWKLELLLEICLLIEIGFEHEEIWSLITREFRFRNQVESPWWVD